MSIKIGTLCWVVGPDVPARYLGRVVEVVGPLQMLCTASHPNGCMNYMVRAEWIPQPRNECAARPENLKPFSDPDPSAVERYKEPLAPMVPVDRVSTCQPLRLPV